MGEIPQSWKNNLSSLAAEDALVCSLMSSFGFSLHLEEGVDTIFKFLDGRWSLWYFLNNPFIHNIKFYLTNLLPEFLCIGELLLRSFEDVKVLRDLPPPVGKVFEVRFNLVMFQVNYGISLDFTNFVIVSNLETATFSLNFGFDEGNLRPE